MEPLFSDNLFGIDVQNNLVPSQSAIIGNVFKLDYNSDLQLVTSPTSSRYWEMDENGDIVPTLVTTYFDDYSKLITPLYKNKIKFMSLLNAYLQKILQPKLEAQMIDEAFYLETAVGNQLDVLGDIIGQSRKITFTPVDGSGDLLNDTNYRIILKAAIIRNFWKGDILTIENLWDNLFSDISMRIYDNQDMTMSIYLSGYISSLFQELVEHGYIIPKPQCVKIKSITYANNLPEFGYDQETGLIDGYDKGNWKLDITE